MATWYIDPNGNDSNSGTAPGPADAFLTLQRAHDAASPFDGVSMAGGTYPAPDPTIDAIPLVVTKNNIGFQADGTGDVILDGNNTARCYVQIATGGDFFSIQTDNGQISVVEIKNCRWRGIETAGAGRGSFVFGLYIHHIGNRSESSATPIAGIYNNIDAGTAGQNMFIEFCQFGHIGRTNTPAVCYDAGVVLDGGRVAVTNSNFCDMFNGWGVRALAGSSLFLGGNWFFGANGFPAPGQVSFEGQLGSSRGSGGLTVDSNIFYDPGTTALNGVDFSCSNVVITNNQVYTDSGATLANFTGALRTGNTIDPLSSYTGTFPCGTGAGNDSGINPDFPGDGGLSVPTLALGQLGIVQTFIFDEIYYNRSIRGGASGSWDLANVIINVSPSGAFGLLNYSSGAANFGDTDLHSVAGDDISSWLYYYPLPPGSPRDQVNPINVNTSVEGFPVCNGYNYDSAQGGWEYDGYIFVLAGLDLAHGGGSQRVGMFARPVSGGPWLEYDAANCPGVVPYSWFDGALQPAGRRTKDRRYVDVCHNVGDYYSNPALTHIALNTFDFHTRTWTGDYGDIDVPVSGTAPVDFRPGNAIRRYGNGDVGVFYSKWNGGNDTTVIYREYSKLGTSWGSEVVVAASATLAPWWGNFAPDPDADLMRCFLYSDTETGGGLSPQYWTVAQGGTVTGPIFSFPNYTDGTDGTNNPIVFKGFVYVPYDNWDADQNQVWVCPVGGNVFVPQPLPPPDVESGNPSCAFMVLTGIQSQKRYMPQYTKNAAVGNN